MWDLVDKDLFGFLGSRRTFNMGVNGCNMWSNIWLDHGMVDNCRTLWNRIVRIGTKYNLNNNETHQSTWMVCPHKEPYFQEEIEWDPTTKKISNSCYSLKQP